jgi:hypothetical protein
VTYVVDCSIIIRLLASRPGDELLRQRLSRTVHAPALIDAEVSSVIRGLAITTKSNTRISEERALEMLHDYAGLRIVRHPMHGPARHAAGPAGQGPGWPPRLHTAGHGAYHSSNAWRSNDRRACKALVTARPNTAMLYRPRVMRRGCGAGSSMSASPSSTS